MELWIQARWCAISCPFVNSDMHDSQSITPGRRANPWTSISACHSQHVDQAEGSTSGA